MTPRMCSVSLMECKALALILITCRVDLTTTTTAKQPPRPTPTHLNKSKKANKYLKVVPPDRGLLTELRHNLESTFKANRWCLEKRKDSPHPKNKTIHSAVQLVQDQTSNALATKSCLESFSILMLKRSRAALMCIKTTNQPRQIRQNLNPVAAPKKSSRRQTRRVQTRCWQLQGRSRAKRTL